MILGLKWTTVFYYDFTESFIPSDIAILLLVKGYPCINLIVVVVHFTFTLSSTYGTERLSLSIGTTNTVVFLMSPFFWLLKQLFLFDLFI